MKPFNQPFFQDRTDVFYWPPGENPSSTTSRPTSGRVLIAVPNGGTLHGDFKSPNSFHWYGNDLQAISGNINTWVTSSRKMYQQSYGNLGAFVPQMYSATSDPVFNRTLSEVNEKIRNGVDWSVTAGQMSQVTSMLKSTGEVIRHIKRFDIPSLRGDFDRFIKAGGRFRDSHDWRRVSKALGGKWLEFQYGWKPLAQDIYDSIVELGKEFPGLMVVSAMNTDVTKKTYRIPFELNSEATLVVDSTDSHRCRMKIRYLPSSSTINLLSNFTGMNPASFAWELTPWSFVVDWFYDVGGYLRNLETSLLVGSQFRDGFYTLSRRLDCYGSCQYVGRLNSELTTSISAGGYNNFKESNRVRLTEMPYPRAPSFRADLGAGRLLNSAALMSQFLGVKAK